MGLLGLLVAMAISILGMVAAIDAGTMDRSIEAWASRLSGRTIRFGALHSHMLSATPWIEIDDLRIANPAGFPPGDLARVRHVVAKLRPMWFWAWSHEIDALHLDGVALSLIRYGPNRNNWSMSARPKAGPAFAALAGVQDFQLSRGQLRFHDLARDLDVAGPFAVGTGQVAFRFRGSGLYGGELISATMTGGPLHGSTVGHPYPFAGELIDGLTHVAVRGASAQPFDLSAYRLAVDASGANLADIGYLFHLITPNSLPYRLRAIVTSGNGIMRIGRIDVRTATSHVTGKIWSNHSDPRRDIHARLSADRLDRADIDAMLAAVPPRAAARSRSGAIPPGPRSRFIISPAPLGVSRLRATDLDFDIGVGTLSGYPLHLHDIVTRLDLDHGLLDMPSFRAALAGGTVTANGRIDARPSIPRTRMAMRFDALQLGQLSAGKGQAGTVDGELVLSGSGASLHAAAAAASGSGELRVSALAMPKAASWMIGGDLLRAATSSLSGTQDAMSASVVAQHFVGRNGHFASSALTARTSKGVASGDASIDFANEGFCAYLAGQPAQHRLFQVSAPFRIAGPWLSPKVTILPSPKARKLGLHGKLGVLLTPVAGLLPISSGNAPQRGCP